MSQTTRRLLVDIDCLLDTRLATIHDLDPQAAIDLVEGTAYFNRFRDNYEHLTGGRVTQDAFETRYARRDKEILQKARPTPVLRIVNDIAHDIAQQAIVNDMIDPLEIVINIYPYHELSAEERHALTVALGHYVDLETLITTDDIDPKHITPSSLKNDWAGLIIYDLDSWLSLHIHDFDQTLAPQTLVFAPALYLTHMDGVEEDPALAELADQGISPFEVVEYSLTERFNLSLLSARHFSLVDLDEK